MLHNAVTVALELRVRRQRGRPAVGAHRLGRLLSVARDAPSETEFYRKRRIMVLLPEASRPAEGEDIDAQLEAEDAEWEAVQAASAAAKARAEALIEQRERARFQQHAYTDALEEQLDDDDDDAQGNAFTAAVLASVRSTATSRRQISLLRIQGAWRRKGSSTRTQAERKAAHALALSRSRSCTLSCSHALALSRSPASHSTHRRVACTCGRRAPVPQAPEPGCDHHPEICARDAPASYGTRAAGGGEGSGHGREAGVGAGGGEGGGPGPTCAAILARRLRSRPPPVAHALARL